MRLWNTETGHCIRVFEGEHARSIAWSPDQKQALSASKVCVRLWDIETGECLRAFRGHTNGVYCLVWPANQRRFLSASTDGTVRLWDVDTGRCLQVLKHDGVGYVAWSADHLGVLSAGVDIRLWDPETGACRQVLQGHSDTVRSIEWSTIQGCAVLLA
jgi:WD40 repeat protein